jgi:AraC family transcriptional regulator
MSHALALEDGDDGVGAPAPARPFQWGSLTTAELFTSRSWSDGSAFNFRRSAQEMSWVSDQHRVSLQLRPVRDASIQVEGGRTSEFAALAPLSFTPAGVAIRTVMSESTVLAVMQSPQTYDDLAAEMTGARRIDLDPLWSIDDPVLERLARLMQREIADTFGDDLLMPVLSRAIAVQIARYFAGPRARLAETGKLAVPRVGRVLDYIDAHLGDRLSLDAIADIACLSPFHFTRCFKYTVGSSLHQYVIRRRIRRARELIALSRLSLAEIAVSVGFDSQAALTSRFTREMGIAPGAYRREFLGERGGQVADERE